VGWRSLRLLAVLLVGTAALSAQGDEGLFIDPDYSPQRLIEEVFAVNRCATISNVQIIGDHPEGIGYFRDPEGVTGFREGIVLSTGRVRDAVGPNTTTSTGTRFGGPTSDVDLNVVSSRTLYDRVGIEFDFIPLEPTITFRYVFASEEYCEFVSASYNDIFGFFVSGPGFDGPYAGGAENVATVPDGRRPVSIATINHRRNREFYLDNEFANIRRSAGCGGEATVGPRFTQIEYDGQTVILTATLNVQPCATYHLRLVVADVEDADLDSAVFLEAGSFDVGGGATFENGQTGDRSPIRVFEGCGPQNVRLRRAPNGDLTRPQTVNYRLGTGSVATDPADFAAGEGTVVIPAGANFVDFPISAATDTLTEGPEVAWLVLDSPCGCFVDSIQIVVDEATPPVLSGPVRMCGAVAPLLSVAVTGGVPPYRYRWDFGSESPNPSPPLPLPDSVGVTVTDACGQVTELLAPLAPASAPELSLLPLPVDSCGGDTAELTLTLSGSPPFTLRYRIDGEEEQSVTFSAAGTTTWPLTRAGGYRLLQLTDQVCVRQLDTTINVNLRQPLRPLTFDCAQLRRFPLLPRPEGGRPPYTYGIDGGPFRGEEVWDSLPAGTTYTLRIRDGIGCEIVQEDFFYPKAERFPVRLPATLVAERGERVRLRPEVRVPPTQIASYRWQSGAGLSCSDCREPELTATVSRPIALSVTDVFGCSYQVATEVIVSGPPPYYLPTAFSPNGDGRNDEFRVFADEEAVAEVVYLRVYDRWGGAVWSSEGAEGAVWDGRFRGRAAAAGVYVWVVGVRLRDGSLSESQGTVTLLPR
jgi:gliding motility-associated-like protein